MAQTNPCITCTYDAFDMTKKDDQLESQFDNLGGSLGLAEQVSTTRMVLSQATRRWDSLAAAWERFPNKQTVNWDHIIGHYCTQSANMFK